MSIEIQKLVRIFSLPCPKCKSTVFIKDWGKNKCRHEKCDGHEFNVELNLETATELLKQIQVEKQSEPPIERVSKPPTFRLQRLLDGWICVEQP